jgi:hypothetical protein
LAGVSCPDVLSLESGHTIGDTSVITLVAVARALDLPWHLLELIESDCGFDEKVIVV